MNKNKTNKAIKIIVLIIVFLLILSSFAPYIFGANVIYKNEAMEIEIALPEESIKTMEIVGEGTFKAIININLIAVTTKGDIFSEEKEAILKANKELDKDRILRENVYLESDFLKKTWGNEEYIKNYFNDILNSSKGDYTITVEKTKLSGIPAWRAFYNSASTTSSGYYYLTINGGYLYVIQLDAYAKPIDQMGDVTNPIISSFKILKVYEQEGYKTKVQSFSFMGYSFQDLITVLLVVIVGALSIYYYIKQRNFAKRKQERQKQRNKKRKS